LRYVLAHPEAMDAIEGIAEYWLTRQKVDERVQEVLTIVNELVDEGILVERRSHDGRSIYAVNKEMLEQIQHMI